MPGLFTQAAGVLAAREAGQHDAELEAERKRRQQQDDSDRAIQRAATVAALRNQGIVGADDRETVTASPTVDRRGLTLPSTPNLTQAPGTGVDQGRYADLGGGYYQDKTKTTEAIQERALKKHEQIIQRRMVLVKRLHPELDADSVRSIAENEKTNDEYVKPTEADYSPLPAGDTNVFDKHSGTTKPTGQAPIARPPVLGTKEYEDAEKRLAEIRAAARDKRPATESPDVTATRKDIGVLRSNEIRSEHQVGFAKSDLKAFDVGHSRKAQLPLPEQRTAADSAVAKQRAALVAALTDANSSYGRAKTSADSATTALARLRAAGRIPPPEAPATPAAHVATPVAPPAPTPPRAATSSKPDVARIQQESTDYVKARSAIQASGGSDVASRLKEAERIYLARIQKLNKGQDPDSE